MSGNWRLGIRASDSTHEAIERDGLWWTPGSYASGATADYSNAAATQEVGWYSENSSNGTKAVGLKQANGLDVYDMSGNGLRVSSISK